MNNRGILIPPELLLITINRNMILTKLDFDPKFGSKTTNRLTVNQKLLLMLILKFGRLRVGQNRFSSSFGAVWQRTPKMHPNVNPIQL